MKKLIILTFTICILFNNSFADSKKEFILHIDDNKIAFKKNVFEWAESGSEIYNLYVGKKIIQKINDDFSILIIIIDAKKSDARGIIYLSGSKKGFKIIDYIYAIDDTIDDILLYDIDRDTKDEIITVWSGEDSYNIRVDKVKDLKTNIIVENLYCSNQLGNPQYFNFDKKLCISNGNIYVLYEFYSKNKISVLKSNPNDPTSELYLKPIGVVSEKEWKKMEVNDNK